MITQEQPQLGKLNEWGVKKEQRIKFDKGRHTEASNPLKSRPNLSPSILDILCFVNTSIHIL